MKRLKIKDFLLRGMVAAFFLFSPGTGRADDAPAASEPTLEDLKVEWEAVREQQIQMIREKEDQLEKLKEEIFAEMKALNEPAVSKGSDGLEAQKAAFQAERKKFFAEMNRQKDNLRRREAALDEKAKQLEAGRERFEQERKAAA